MSDETQPQEAPEAPAEPAAEASAPEAPAPQAEPSINWQERYQGLEAESRQYRSQVEQQWAAAQQAQKEFQERLLGAFGVKQEQPAPQYMTREQVQQLMQEQHRQASVQSHVQAYRREMPQVKAKYGEMLAALPGGEAHLAALWQNSPDKSLMEIAAELDSALAKSFEARQAKWQQGKATTAAAMGKPLPQGGAPAPVADNGLRGRERLRAVSRRLAGGGDQ